MTSTRYDIVIVGGGLLGLATAMTLARNGHGSIAVIEAEPGISRHQSGNNSGIIHSGLYYKPGSLKAQNCMRGRDLLYAFCDEHQIAYERCGKVVVATETSQLEALQALEARGRENGLQLRRLDASAIKQVEPHVRGVAGLWVPETGIVDYGQVAQAYARIFEDAAGDILPGRRLIDVQPGPQSFRLLTTNGELECGFLINCAGLQSDRLARMCGFEPDLRIVPFRGEYYEIAPASRHLVRNLVYPVPEPNLPFLGVHFTRRIDGSVEAGPNAVLALKREGYRRTDLSLKDTWDTLSYSGFWRLAARYWRVGLGENVRSLSKRAYLRDLRKLIPELTTSDIVHGGAGVRAQALGPDGALIDDFKILAAERMVHVLNAPSPGATASISIGEMIAEMAESDINSMHTLP